MARPLFKNTSDKKSFSVDTDSAYYGSVKQRSRREAQLEGFESDFSAGTLSFDDFTTKSNLLKNRAVGLSERTGISTSQTARQTEEYSRLDSDQSSAYSTGNLSYEEYRDYLESTLARYDTDSAEYTARSSDIDDLDLAKAESDIDDIVAEYNRGEVDYDEMIDELLGYRDQFAEGTDARISLEETLQDAKSTATTRELNSLAQQYSEGSLTYEEYIASVQEVGAGLTADFGEDIDEASVAFSEYENLTLSDGTTFGDYISGLTETYNVAEETRMESAYESGTITFEEYADFLSSQLNLYTDGSSRSTEISDAWKEAYSTELENYYTEVSTQRDAGTITESEWAEFNDWYAKQVKAGPQLSSSIEEFTSSGTSSSGKSNKKSDSSSSSGSYKITKSLSDLKNVTVSKAYKKLELGDLKSERRSIIDQLKEAREKGQSKKVAALKKKRNQLTKAILLKRR